MDQSSRRTAWRPDPRPAATDALGKNVDPYFRSKDPWLRTELLARYQPLVCSLARKFSGNGNGIDDLISVANIGLLTALDRFDPDRETTFGGYASCMIRWELQHYLRAHRSMIRVPRDVLSLIRRIDRVTERLTQEYGRPPSTHEVSEGLGVPERTVLQALDATAVRQPVSLEHSSAPVAVDSPCPPLSSVKATGADAGPGSSADLGDALAQLDESSRALVEWYYFDGWSQPRIAREWGLTQSTVSRRIKEVLKLLRQRLEKGKPRGQDSSRCRRPTVFPGRVRCTGDATPSGGPRLSLA